MRGKIGWATVAVGLALCASPSLTMATALVKISVRIPEGAAAGDKLGPTEELARLLLGPRVQASLLPSAAERGTTLRYQAAQWNQAVDEARRDAACAACS